MKALQSWSPRTRPLNYDSLQQDTGCQDAYGTSVFSVLPFSRICIAEHLAGSIFERPGTISYATGPLNTGSGLPWVTRWAAWVASAGVRIAKLPLIVPPSNSIGSPSSFYGTTKPPKVSINFASNGQLALAIQKTDETIEIKYFKDSSGLLIGTESFLGTSPLLFQTGLIPHDEDDIQDDLVVYYLRREIPRTIFVRVKREGFQVEHILNQNLQADVSELIAVEASGSKIVLYGRDSIGRDITLYTSDYLLLVDGDKATLHLGIDRGAYRLTAVNKVTATQKTTLALSISAGAYSSPIVSAALSPDATSLSLSISAGEYL